MSYLATKHKRIIASGLVETGAVELCRIHLTGNGAAAQIQVFDDTAGTNPAEEIDHIEAANGKTEDVCINYRCRKGLYIAISGANAVCDVYYN